MCVKHNFTYLMHFVPALRILGSQNSMIMQQSFCYFRITLFSHREVHRREIFGVSVIRRSTELQQCTRKNRITLNEAINEFNVCLLLTKQLRSYLSRRLDEVTYFHL